MDGAAGSDAQAQSLVYAGQRVMGMPSMGRRLQASGTCVVGQHVGPLIKTAKAIVQVPKLTGSTILSAADQTWLGPTLRKLFPAGGHLRQCFAMSRDGTSAATFHTKCNGKAPTITVMRTSTGLVIGGTAVDGWGGNDGDHGVKELQKLLLFSVSLRRVFKQGPDWSKAMARSTAYGPAWGDTGGEIGWAGGNVGICATGSNKYYELAGVTAAALCGGSDISCGHTCFKCATFDCHQFVISDLEVYYHVGP